MNGSELLEKSLCALDLVKKALVLVDSKYVVLGDLTDNNDFEVYKQVERCFAYELYHQIRVLIDEYNKINQDNIEVNAELPKHIENFTRDNYPDLIIHGGQNNFDEEKQLLVCEIKRHRNRESDNLNAIASDLNKLASYSKLEYITKGKETNNIKTGFHTACFIMTNNSNDKIRDYIKEIKENYEKYDYNVSIEEEKNIYILTYPIDKEKNKKYEAFLLSSVTSK